MTAYGPGNNILRVVVAAAIRELIVAALGAIYNYPRHRERGGYRLWLTGPR